ncbi:hypothetical protein [Allobaculum sp. Allo2]|uniref:hypothetical protein n=1 Tax=Allobaculum sp. Allo2 TaxID=2853432 RepID=UPI001F609BFE|nr:hypothetical protein [Allobaculum sp. Allo2]UNT93162.1 hypothetical protein KWG61_14320 [Allobaculum sp. Allo2]
MGRIALSVFFGLPILLCCLICDQDSKVPLCAFLAMFLLMFMLSGITTWLVAGSMLVCGYVFGRGAIRQKNLLFSVWRPCSFCL